MLYAIIIIVSMAIISLLNIIFSAPVFGISPAYIICAVTISTAAEIVIDGFFAFIVRWLLPETWFSVEKYGFSASKKECRFYEKIGIKKWKDKVIELGCFTKFRKNKIAEPNNAEYIKRYIVEANYGIACHSAIIIFSILVIFVYPLKYWYCFGLPVAIVSIFLNLLPLFILRYNLPKLHALYKFNLKRASQG